MKRDLFDKLKRDLTEYIDERFKWVEALLHARTPPLPRSLNASAIGQPPADVASTCHELPISVSSELCLAQQASQSGKNAVSSVPASSVTNKHSQQCSLNLIKTVSTDKEVIMMPKAAYDYQQSLIIGDVTPVESAMRKSIAKARIEELDPAALFMKESND